MNIAIKFKIQGFEKDLSSFTPHGLDIIDAYKKKQFAGEIPAEVMMLDLRILFG